MKSIDIEKIFKEIGVILDGHFLLSSGLHSNIYFQKFKLFEHPDITHKLCKEIAEHFKELDFTTVAGPTTGGMIVAYEVASILNKRFVFAEKENNKRVFRRNEIEKGEKILVVDDVMTTGNSIKNTIDAIKISGGIVVGIGVLVDRSEFSIDLPVFSVYKKIVKNYNPDECPLCKEGIKLIKPGGK